MPLTATQLAELEAFVAELPLELDRTGVDLPAAFPQLHDYTAAEIREGRGNVMSATSTMNIPRIVVTLRAISDRAGTDAFVSAYNRAP